MPDVRLDVVDAAELAELLQFLSRWLARDRGRLGASLEEFVGHPAYNVGELRQDLDRFTFLLGGDDGESLSATARPSEVMTMASPLREPKSTEGGGFAATHFPGAPRRLRGRSSGPKGAAHRLRATALRAALDPGDHCGPWGQEERAGPGLPPPARSTQTRRRGAYRSKPDVRTQVN